MPDTPYDYDGVAADTDSRLKQLEGRVLRRVLVDVVIDQFNVVWLEFGDAAFAIQGQIGGELLGVVAVDAIPPEGPRSEMAAIRPHPPFVVFQGRRLVRARSLGRAWNGHGFEFSFEGLPGRTMLVQSVYAGEVPTDFDNCLRLGVGHYQWHAAPPVE